MTTPIPTFSRNEDGLINGIVYVRDSLGRIDWRAMIPSQYLYVSPEAETEVKVRQNVKTKWDVDVTKCEDKELLITLAGLNYLAHLRGIFSEPTPTLHVTPENVTCVCSIEFIPNFENPDGLIVSGVGSASLHSVSGKFQLYLSTMAHNRALTRAIKKALRIEILGFEEVDFRASKAFEDSLKKGDSPLETKLAAPETPAPAFTLEGYDGNAFLAKRCGELDRNGSHTFEKIQAHALTIRAELESDPATWTGFASIPRKDSFILVAKINEAAVKKATKKKT